MQGANRSRSGALAAICNLRRAPKSTNFQQSEELFSASLNRRRTCSFNSPPTTPRHTTRPRHVPW